MNLLRQVRQAASTSARSTPTTLDEPDVLEAEHLQPLAQGHAGLPEATDSLAYDPVQHLLAVMTLLMALRPTFDLCHGFGSHAASICDGNIIYIKCGRVL